MTQTTTTTLDTRQRRLEERHTLEDAAAIIEHVSIENRSVNQLRTLEAAAAIQRKRDARNSAARERRLRQRRSAEARAQLDALDVRLSAEHQQRERERIERIQQLDAARDALHAAQRAAIDAAPTPALAQAMRYFAAAERNPAAATRNLRLAWEWVRRDDDGPAPDDDPCHHHPGSPTRNATTGANEPANAPAGVDDHPTTEIATSAPQTALPPIARATLERHTLDTLRCQSCRTFESTAETTEGEFWCAWCRANMPPRSDWPVRRAAKPASDAASAARIAIARVNADRSINGRRKRRRLA